MTSTAKKNPAALAGANGVEIEVPRQELERQPNASERSSQAKWNAENPKAMWAHQALRSAIRRGLIERGPCEECGAVHGDTIVHGHHDDYNKPMAVRWLCVQHHRQLHAAARGKGGEA